MKTLSCDIETFSSNDLIKCGVYKYAQAPDFQVLLFAYSIDDGEVKVVDLVSGEQIPQEVIDAIFDPNVYKWAYNAQFERVCLSAHFKQYLAPDSWRCTMVWAATLGLPLSLESAGQVLGLTKQKMKEGKDLIRFFSIPCNPTKTNGGRKRNLPYHAPDKWLSFKEYNIRDVEVELGIKVKLKNFPVSETEWSNYILDQQINDRGVRLDMTFVKQAIRCDEQFNKTHMDMARNLTGLQNPNSTQQLKGWLAENGLNVESLDKAAVHALLENAQGEVEQALKLRLELAKSSVKKFVAMKASVCSDGRAHGLFQFYGAGRTGRFAGRLIQVQNLPQNHLPDLEMVRALIRAGSFDVVELLYDSVPIVLSELIRTAFIPKDGQILLVADFSAIEARVIAWLAGETWRQEVFATHGKIYEASAAQMFNVPIEEVTKGSLLRQKGKVAELALGYGGSVGALTAMGAITMGLTEAELSPLVKAWREANPKIVQLWWDVDKAAQKAVKEETEVQLGNLTFKCQSKMLFIKLPSGRHLSYVKPLIETNRFEREGITYEGVGEAKKWCRIDSYGPKFVENIVQAISRDLLVEAMQRLDKAGYQIVMHCHDEVVVEAANENELEALCELMGQTPAWATGLSLIHI